MSRATRKRTRRQARDGAALAASRGGATAVEFALLAPILCLLVLGGVEFGRLLWTQSALNFSVEEAARCGVVNPDGDCATSAEVESFAASKTPQVGFPTSAFTAVKATCGYQVTASYVYKFIVTGLFPVNPTLTAKACFPT
jgi:Flp pilus assembly protein TadG